MSNNMSDTSGNSNNNNNNNNISTSIQNENINNNNNNNNNNIIPISNTLLSSSSSSTLTPSPIPMIITNEDDSSQQQSSSSSSYSYTSSSSSSSSSSSTSPLSLSLSLNDQSPSGILIGFGSGSFGLLLNDDDNLIQSISKELNLLKNRSIISLSVGSTHSLAVAADSSLLVWGSNDDGQLGIGQNNAKKIIRTPTEIESIQTKQIVSSSAGYAHSLITTSNGEVFSFGQGELGQLGLTLSKRSANQQPDLSTHYTPSLVKELSNITRIIAVACGDGHSLALSTAGRVYSVGDGSRGALGLNLDLKRPIEIGNNNIQNDNDLSVSGGKRVAVFTEITSLLPIPICSIAAGAHHSLFVSAAGTAYSCGDASKGRLGFSFVSTSSSTTVTTSTQHFQWLPKRILGQLENKHCCSASGGAQYSLFLTQDHLVYSTGNNFHGELGLDMIEIKQTDTPIQISSLPPILQISAGATHAIARSANNDVYVWGSGENGELGRGPEYLRNSSTPLRVKFPQLFPQQHIVSISAGSNTSYVIIAQTVLDVSIGMTSLQRMNSDGTIQLPTTPSIQSPSNYTLFARQKFPFHFYGLNSHLNNSISAPISTTMSDTSSSVSSIIPFLVAPQRSVLPLNSFSYTHFTSLVKKSDYNQLSQYISHCFSSALILNASFLPRLSAGGGSHIDSQLLELVYKKILECSIDFPKIQGALNTSLQKMVQSMVQLLKIGGKSPPLDSSAYRCLIIALSSPHLHKASASETELLSDICGALLRIPTATYKKLSTNIFPRIPSNLLQKRIIKALLKNVEARMISSLVGKGPSVRLRAPSEEIQSLIIILDSIHQSVVKKTITSSTNSNSSIALLLPPDNDDGDNTELNESAWHLNISPYLNLNEDIDRFRTPTPTASQLKPFSFMQYPYLISPSSKVAYLSAELGRSMQQQQIGALLMGNMNPVLNMKVRRSHLVEDTVNVLNAHRSQRGIVFELAALPLKVTFDGELGEDQGGLSAEFFELLFSELVSPQYQLFEVNKEWNTYWFSSIPTDPSSESLFELFGELLALAIANHAVLSLQFPKFLYSQLLSIQPSLIDLQYVDPLLFRSMIELLKFEGDVENVFCLTMQRDIIEILPTNNNTIAPPPNSDQMIIDSSSSSSSSSSPSTALVPARRTRLRSIPLIPDGNNIPVTSSNRFEYVRLYLSHLFTGEHLSALKPLINGFQGTLMRSHTKPTSLNMFSAKDLELLVIGNNSLNIIDLKKTVIYEGGYNSTHKIVEWFWSIILNDFNLKQQRSLLFFTTGSSRAPVGGLEEIKLIIQRAGPDSDLLPTSSTCFHALLIPEYISKEKLKTKLLIAIEFSEGFGLR